MKTKFSTLALAYLAVLIAFGVLDGIWLGVIAMPMYVEHFDGILRDQFISWPWIVFYLLYCLSVVILAVKPALHKSVGAAAINGFILGATAYGTYNLTAYSIVADWPLNMTLIDWLWGSVATCILAATGSAVARLRI
ncbi:DUF2177 family protein [Salinimonas sp. HHU 13199]|uniref:DUF2177 family protein n=1 Tax=Salinimonas profundi TaxID=2729140 RepID=A0ABR8LMX1_9ALTE|nr:DUF2177 family protein [Salinimonas profundi]MBD3585747.1 DUF2177 family protein [Salinimonas profundi]